MFGLKPPTFAHLPLLLNDKGQKLSKRFGDVSVQAYKDKGYLPEAMINGLALLGWNPPHKVGEEALEKNGNFSKHEVLSMQEILSMVFSIALILLFQFDLEKVGKSGVKFSLEKLEYFNSMHIRNRFDATLLGHDPTETWRSMLLEYLPSDLHSAIQFFDTEKMTKIMNLMKIRIHFFHDMMNHTYFFRDPQYESQMTEKFMSKLKLNDA